MDIMNVTDLLPKTEQMDAEIKASDLVNQLQFSSAPLSASAMLVCQSMLPTQLSSVSDPLLTPVSPVSSLFPQYGNTFSKNDSHTLGATLAENVSLTLQELLDPSSKTENVLGFLTPEQLSLIEKTLNKVKRRKLSSMRKTKDAIVKPKLPNQPHHIVPKLQYPTSPTSPVTKGTYARTATSPPLQTVYPPTPPATTFSEVHSLTSLDFNVNIPKVSDGLASPPPEKVLKPTSMSNSRGTVVSVGSIPIAASPTSSPDFTIPSTPPKTEPKQLGSASVSPTTNGPTSPSPQQTHSIAAAAALSCHEPVTEIKDGVEWVSFIYSHNRTLKQYSVRTDVDSVNVDELEEKFKTENCVYPRANLPRETYQGNRWAYETECNILGWKLAWLNQSEISGKRGLIQRAVDSYRNRYPSMRSRRVARQEKLMNGTLRKRKNRDGPGNNSSDDDHHTQGKGGMHQCNKIAKHHYHDKISHSDRHPKTLCIDDFAKNMKYRIRINIDDVDLSEIDNVFKKNNCVYPRAMSESQESALQGNQSRWNEQREVNELGWKLAWLNPRHLANKKTLLQRALDVYRSKFLPHLKPRKSFRRSLSSLAILHNIPQMPPSTITNFSQLRDSPANSTFSCDGSASNETLKFYNSLSSAVLGNPVDPNVLLANKSSSNLDELLNSNEHTDGEPMVGDETERGTNDSHSALSSSMMSVRSNSTTTTSPLIGCGEDFDQLRSLDFFGDDELERSLLGEDCAGSGFDSPFADSEDDEENLMRNYDHDNRFVDMSSLVGVKLEKEEVDGILRVGNGMDDLTAEFLSHLLN